MEKNKDSFFDMLIKNEELLVELDLLDKAMESDSLSDEDDELLDLDTDNDIYLDLDEMSEIDDDFDDE